MENIKRNPENRLGNIGTVGYVDFRQKIKFMVLGHQNSLSKMIYVSAGVKWLNSSTAPRVPKLFLFLAVDAIFKWNKTMYFGLLREKRCHVEKVFWVLLEHPFSWSAEGDSHILCIIQTISRAVQPPRYIWSNWRSRNLSNYMFLQVQLLFGPFWNEEAANKIGWWFQVPAPYLLFQGLVDSSR